jgi:hypothetical protein
MRGEKVAAALWAAIFEAALLVGIPVLVLGEVVGLLTIAYRIGAWSR